MASALCSSLYKTKKKSRAKSFHPESAQHDESPSSSRKKPPVKLRSNSEFMANTVAFKFGWDDKHKTVYATLHEMKCDGEHIHEFLWQLKTVFNKSDEKESSGAKKAVLSSLIDIEASEMCSRGHCNFSRSSDVGCYQCFNSENEYNAERSNDKYCKDCLNFDKYTNPQNYDKTKKKYGVCASHRKKNATIISKTCKLNEKKKKIIRNELSQQPSLSMDLLCNLPTKPALDSLMDDILSLQVNQRKRFMVLQIDIDNLKALNSLLGYTETNRVIKDVADVLKDYEKQVNAGKWQCVQKHNDDSDDSNNDSDSDEEEEVVSLQRCFSFKTGGDEFVMILQTDEDSTASDTPFGEFYESWKTSINELAKKNKYKALDNGKREALKTLKERKKMKIFDAFDPVELSNNLKQTISKAVDDTKEMEFNMDFIGISVGCFIPKTKSKEKQWLKCAEIALDAAKQISGKNEISIYFERKGIVPIQKTKKCLLKGCIQAFVDD
eukprot:111865_1